MFASQNVESDSDLEKSFAELSRTEYSWTELQVRPLPPGVDPAKIETYLSNDVFLVSLDILIEPCCSTYLGSTQNTFVFHVYNFSRKSLRWLKLNSWHVLDGSRLKWRKKQACFRSVSLECFDRKSIELLWRRTDLSYINIKQFVIWIVALNCTITFIKNATTTL